MVMDEALDGADCTRSSYIEITADSIRIGVLPDMERMSRYERRYSDRLQSGLL